MSIIPCEENANLRKLIEKYAERLKTQAHLIGDHGLSEEEFYRSGLFRGAIERVRGQFAAEMREKREFVQHVLDYMKGRGYILNWESVGDANRHDYKVHLRSGRTAFIELKGCLDGNNTNIFTRPPEAQEFVIWSVCTNPAADPRHNAWSGIHTRLSAEIIFQKISVDGVIIWDMFCGTFARPCPKVGEGVQRKTKVGQFFLPPPCIYVFPATVPDPENNPNPSAQRLEDVHLLKAFHDCFHGRDEEVNYVTFWVRFKGERMERKTCVVRNGEKQRESGWTVTRR